MNGGGLYPPPNGLIYNNYPPLSFFIVGLVGKLTGDMLIAGRLVALFAIVASALLIGRVSFVLTQSKLAASNAVLIFALYNVTLFRSYFVMDDPQWLGQFFALIGLAILLSKEINFRYSYRVIFSAIFFVAGGFVKNNLVGIPLAVTIWLAIENRAVLMVWLAASSVALVVGFSLCFAFFGTVFFQDIFLVPRGYSLLVGFSESYRFLLFISPMVFATLWLLCYKRESAPLRLMLFCALITLVTGVMERGGAGVNINAYFESLCILCILSGFFLAYQPKRWWLFALPFIYLAPGVAKQGWNDIVTLPQRRAAALAMEAHIDAQPGPVACEDMSYCYWANKGFKLDFFLYGQHVDLTKDDKALREAIREHKIVAAEISPFSYKGVYFEGRLPVLMQLSKGVIYRSGEQFLIKLSDAN